MREKLGLRLARMRFKKSGRVIVKPMSRAQFERSREWVFKKYAEAWRKLGQR